MEELNMRSLTLSIMMALAGVTMSFAGTSVWSYDNPNAGEMKPAYWYSYGDSSSQTYGVRKVTTEGYQQFTATLNLQKEGTSAAGFGFAWKQTNKQDVPIDLSSYEGLCLTYKATHPFRVDFKQSDITDYDFHGVYLSAEDEFVSKFIDFKNLSQEGWGNTVALDLTQQLTVQINYKTGIANQLGADVADRNINVITVSEVSLGACQAVEPEENLKILAPYDKVQTDTLNKSDTLKIDLKKIFSAKDTSGIVVRATMTKAVLAQISPETSISMDDEIVFIPTGIDKDTTVSLIFIALGGTESAMAQFDLFIKNEGANLDEPVCPGDPRCPDVPPTNHPTTVLPPYNVDAVTLSMLETDTMKVVLADMFADEDGDSLVFAVDMSTPKTSPLMTVLSSLDKISLKDTIKIVPVNIRKDTSLIVAVYATDGKSDVAIVQHIVNIKNVSKAPVAASMEFDVKEDESLIVPFVRGLVALSEDPNGLIAIPVDSTKHGQITEFTQLGSFVYTPDLNFNGDDTLTYVLVETADHTSMSNKATIIIHVLPVNDPPGYTIVDSTFLKDTLSYEMNFVVDTASQIKISREALVFNDVEVAEGLQKLTYKAKGTKIEAKVDSVNAKFYFISVKPVLDFCGLASIFLYASDSLDSAGVNIPVNLISPKEVAHAVEDEYTAYNDSVLSVSAKKGVLANDLYPEGVTKGMTAELAEAPTHGKLELAKDGSFKYTPTKDYVGLDIFGYYNVIDGTKSKLGIVKISVEKRNQAPTVVVKPASLDTTVTEDFPTSRALKYPKSVVSSWFKDPEGDALSYSAKSKDGKLKVSFNTAGTMEINSVADSSGKAYVVVTATDKKSGSKSFEFCVNITPVNDKPRVLHADTIYVGQKDTWKAKWDLDTLVFDVDGDELTFTPNETSALKKYMTISIKGSVLTIKSIDGVKYKPGHIYAIGVKVTDSGKLSETIPLYISIDDPPSNLLPVFAQPKATWQNAVMAKKGSVSIMDMQGRRIWSARLPVNPAEVKNASAQVQGRKILRVNNQTWTIK